MVGIAMDSRKTSEELGLFRKITQNVLKLGKAKSDVSRMEILRTKYLLYYFESRVQIPRS
jgi:hypothetical protein